MLDDETIIRAICEILDLDYEEIKDRLPDDETQKTEQAEHLLNNVVPDDEGGGEGEQSTESGTEVTA